MRSRVVQGFGVGIIGLYLTFIASGTCLAQQCVGDCDGSGAVSINELIRGVNIALGVTAAGVCPAFDCPHPHGGTFIDCAVEAVFNALAGCPIVAPTPVTDCAGIPRYRPCIGPCGPPECVLIIPGYCEFDRCVTECAPCVTPTKAPTPTNDCSSAPNVAPCFGPCGMGFCGGGVCSADECTPSATVTRTPTPTRTPSRMASCLPATPIPEHPCGEAECAVAGSCVVFGRRGRCAIDPATNDCYCDTEGPTPTITPTPCQ